MLANAFVAMGTNMPFNGVEGPALLAQALNAMREAGFELRAASGVWRTPAWPAGSEQPDYFNAVAAVDAQGGPEVMYQRLRVIEARFGRSRRTRWEPRTLDLDIVAFADMAGVFGRVIIPHPRMRERAFVLAPLAELAPHWRHPESGETVLEMLEARRSETYRRVSDLAAPAG